MSETATDHTGLEGIPDPEEQIRLQSRTADLLDLLLDRHPHENSECASVGGYSFGGAINRLRKAGWLIEGRHVRGGLWEYRLTGKGPPLPPKLSAAQRKTAHMLLDVLRPRIPSSDLTAALHQLPEWMRKSLVT
jgi:hypothetical protein